MTTSLIKNTESHLRMRLFAGPNGSGKSTVIQNIKNYRVNGEPIDFGIYINADDIAQKLRENALKLTDYSVSTTNKEFIQIALASGLVGKGFNEHAFKASYLLRKGAITLKNHKADERLAQIIADFLRKKLLSEKKKFSFETVFSHPSKLDIMREAANNGYKVYLYFISTESPEINKYRVDLRKKRGGHNVDEDKIFSRYYRSLEQLYDACQIAYQVFFWDNSTNGQNAKMFAHFKMSGKEKKWDPVIKKDIPNWFKKYYSEKIRT